MKKFIFIKNKKDYMDPQFLLSQTLKNNNNEIGLKDYYFLDYQNPKNYITKLFNESIVKKIGLYEGELPASIGLEMDVFDSEYELFIDKCIRAKRIIAPHNKTIIHQNGIIRGIEISDKVNTSFLFTHISKNRNGGDLLIAKMDLQRAHPYEDNFTFEESDFYHICKSGDQVNIFTDKQTLRHKRTEFILEDVNYLFKQLAYLNKESVKYSQ